MLFSNFFNNISRDISRSIVVKMGFFVSAMLMGAPSWAFLSGQYGNLLLGAAQDGQVTGYYKNSTGNGQFNCTFYLRADMRQGQQPYPVYSWTPGNKQVIAGYLFVDTRNQGAPQVALQLQNEPNGCWNVEHFSPKPVVLSNQQRGQWQAVQVVASPRAFFYQSPNRQMTRSYVVQGDAVRIYQRQNGWAYAEYIGPKGQVVRGWLAEQNMFAQNP